MSNHRFLTVDEVAEMMRVSSMTVYRLIKAGELTAIKFGRGYRIQESDLEVYLTKHTTGGPN